MNVFEQLAKLARINTAIEAAEKERRERVRTVLVELVTQARFHSNVHVAVNASLDQVLKASSQASSLGEIAKEFGVYDSLRSLIDKLEGKG